MTFFYKYLKYKNKYKSIVHPNSHQKGGYLLLNGKCVPVDYGNILY